MHIIDIWKDNTFTQGLRFVSSTGSGPCRLHTARGRMGSSKAASTLSWCIFSVKANVAHALLFTRTQEGTQA